MGNTTRWPNRAWLSGIGEDVTIDVGTGEKYETLSAAMSYLSRVTITGSATVTLRLTSDITETKPLIWEHPQSAQIVVNLQGLTRKIIFKSYYYIGYNYNATGYLNAGLFVAPGSALNLEEGDLYLSGDFDTLLFNVGYTASILVNMGSVNIRAGLNLFFMQEAAPVQIVNMAFCDLGYHFLTLGLIRIENSIPDCTFDKPIVVLNGKNTQIYHLCGNVEGSVVFLGNTTINRIGDLVGYDRMFVDFQAGVHSFFKLEIRTSALDRVAENRALIVRSGAEVYVQNLIMENLTSTASAGCIQLYQGAYLDLINATVNGSSDSNIDSLVDFVGGGTLRSNSSTFTTFAAGDEVFKFTVGTKGDCDIRSIDDTKVTATNWSTTLVNNTFNDYGIMRII